MAKTISDEELQLRRRARRRLIGAIALVAVIAVVLPMVLDSEPKPIGQNVEIKIPSPDTGTFASRVVPLAQDGRPPVAGTQAPLPAAPPKPPAVKAAPQDLTKQDQAKQANARTVPANSSAAAPVPAPEAAKSAAPALKPRPVPPEQPQAAQADKSFVIQIAALAEADKARELRARLSANGIKSYTQIVKTVKGDVVRVRAGPFISRDEAERTRVKLKALGLNGNVAQQQ